MICQSKEIHFGLLVISLLVFTYGQLDSTHVSHISDKNACYSVRAVLGNLNILRIRYSFWIQMVFCDSVVKLESIYYGNIMEKSVSSRLAFCNHNAHPIIIRRIAASTYSRITTNKNLAFVQVM